MTSPAPSPAELRQRALFAESVTLDAAVLIALVDRLEDMARLVPNCELPYDMATTDDVMSTPLEVREG